MGRTQIIFALISGGNPLTVYGPNANYICAHLGR